MDEKAVVEPKPSASVVLLREIDARLEVLLVRRNSKIAFHGGAWVFPGGKVDAADGEAEPETLARRAGVRETMEETGIEIAVGGLHYFSHWTTPVDQPKRFSTWFFVTNVEPDVDVKIDGSEIVDARWYAVPDALAAMRAGDITLPPPTYITLLGFEQHRDGEALFAAVAASAPKIFKPRIVALEDGRASLYEEDPGYEASDIEATGARHRLLMRKSGWEYINEIQ